MSIFDWLGPLNRGSTRGGWGDLPAPADLSIATASIPARKASPPPIDGMNAAFTVRTLVHGPGASDLLWGRGDAAGNSAVYACLQTIASAIAEPELRVYQTAPAERVEIDQTPLGALLARPNPHFSLDDLLAYVSDGLHCTGNAYWRKLRAGDPETGNVVELWPIAPARLEPVTENGSSNFIDYYRYWKGSTSPEIIAVSNIVHFRNGISDRDHRLGSGPLARLTREVSADDRATRYADRLLANLGVAGLTLEFDKEVPAIADQAQADEMKTKIMAAFSGDNVGSVAVVSPGGKLVQHGFSPEQLDLKVLHRVPEERIAAVLGVPAIVAGLGAGLDRSTFANVKEAREQFTENKLIPLWSLIASALTLQLLPDFSSDPSIVVDFDLSTVRALSDDQTALATRLQTLVAAGIMDADEARTFIGLEPRASTPASLRAVAGRRQVVIALPASRRERKAAEDLPRRYEELRDDDLPDWESELIAFLESQLRRITRRLRNGADTAEDLVPEGEAVLLGETLTPLQLRTLGAVSRLVEAELGIEFQLDDPATREYLRRAGTNIVGITNTTRSAVQSELTAGQAEGEGIEQLARRIRDLPAFGQARAETIARTELGVSQSCAAISSYQASGVVVGVRIHDGQDFDAPCAARDGAVLSLDAAAANPGLLLHPRCTASWAPIVDADELTRSA